MKNQYEDYKQRMQKLANVEYSIAILNWDKEVSMPKKGAAIRAQQIATLAGIAHELATDDELGRILEDLNSNPDKLNAKQKRNVYLSLKDYKKSKKYTKDFVIRRSKVTSTGYTKWLESRNANDFKPFQKALKDIVDIKREEVELLGFEDHPYDALLDEFEPEAKTADLNILFKDVREQLVQFVRELKSFPQVDDSFLFKKYPKDKQWAFGLKMLKAIGYDFESGRQDLSPHPFTTSFGSSDVRVTTRIDEHNFGNMTWSCIHEGGHALYEQGLAIEEYGLPCGKYVSLGIHESQSRLWENNVGRSLPFWKAHYNGLKAEFGENLGQTSLRDFYKGINKIVPSLIRTESDELHYHFHVLIRFELEKALIEGSLEVDQLEEAWNQKYETYLGLIVPDANHGILQDIHWSMGSLGYFPTYSLGSFYAAQFFYKAQNDIPGLEDRIAEGNTSGLLQWLRDNIHKHGMYYDANQLCEKITGEKLNFKYFMKYVKSKYAEIYKP